MISKDDNLLFFLHTRTMITLISQGHYRLGGLRAGGKILHLDKQGYHWNYAKGIGELLTFCKHPHKIQYLLSQGGYKLFTVRGEPAFIDLQHLELSLGNARWQGYLLLTGLPTQRKLRSRIIATNEVISGNTVSGSFLSSPRATTSPVRKPSPFL